MTHAKRRLPPLVFIIVLELVLDFLIAGKRGCGAKRAVIDRTNRLIPLQPN